jgi:DNA polymerase elongation subunit (family B)
VWRRVDGALLVEPVRFRPWILLDRVDDVRDARGVRFRELDGDGALRFLVHAEHLDQITGAVLPAASRRLGRRIGHLRDLGDAAVLALPPDEQYLVATGRTYFRGLGFDDLRRAQVDLETTGLDPATGRIFLIALRGPDGRAETLEADGDGDAAEAALIERLVARIRALDPDVIENHNLHGFDLPFLERRARALGVELGLGRTADPSLRQRGARRGVADGTRKVRFVAPGRELIDTLDAVMRHDFAARDLPGHGLKAVARHLGLSGPEREQLPGDQIAAIYRRDPDRVRRYAIADVEEVAGLARLLGGPAFALAQMAPRRYERLADAGPATGVIDPLLVRAYLREGAALPAHRGGDGTPHAGASLHLFAAGVAHRIVKADVASLYPSLMRTFRIGPARDRLGALLALVDRLVERRLAAKAAGRAAPPGSAERHHHEAMSAAIKLVVNSAYGYLAAGSLTRFADTDAANQVTRRGREVLDLMCRELAARGVTLLEADTDGVYVAVPPSWDEADERRLVAEVAALLPAGVQLELDGRYAAMLSHEPKNYALRTYDGALILRGVAFRSSRAEPFGAAFLHAAIGRLLVGDVAGVRAAYLETIAALRRRALPTRDVSSLVKLSRTPAEYFELREQRRELPYEAMLASDRTRWEVGERVRVYRTAGGGAAVAGDVDDGSPRDYDVDHYLKLLRATFAARLARAFTPDDFATVFADPDQLELFATPLERIRPVLTVQAA